MKRRLVNGVMISFAIIILQSMAVSAVDFPEWYVNDIAANPSSLVADGTSYSLIVATVNPTTAGMPVYFQIISGTGELSTYEGIPPDGPMEGQYKNKTDSNGKAYAKLKSNAAGNVIVTASIETGNNKPVTVTFTSTDNEPPVVTTQSANPDEILLQESGNADYQHMTARLNATVTDTSGVRSVVIDLSSVGGLPAQPMTNIGGNVWSVLTNATDRPGSKSLAINATDNNGLSNTSVSISLDVLRNGDANNDGNVNSFDVTYLARTLVGIYPPANPLVTDVSGDGNANSFDVTYLARYLAGIYNVLN